MNTQTQNLVIVPLDKILVNQYQSPDGLDQEKVLEIAASLQEYRDNGSKGLLEIPTARLRPDGWYELAFGRHRKAAFEHNFINGHDDFFNAMPLIVRELSDQQMIELMGIEQLQHRDVSILEIAQTFLTYIKTFNKTSVDCAAAFHKSDEYVRSAIRMLNLPEKAKTRMLAGTLNITGARAVLTLTRLLPKDEATLEDVLDAIQVGEPPEEAVIDAFRSSMNTLFIRDDNFSTKAKTFKYLPGLNVDDLEPVYREIFGDYDAARKQQAESELARMHAKNPEPIVPCEERVLHLIKPPACTACPFYAKMGEREVCGWKLCFDRKAEAQQEAVLHEVSAKSGIAIYADADGKYSMLSRWEDKHKAAVEKKHADLRLMRGGNYVNYFPTIGNDIAVVVIGKLCETWKKAEQQARSNVVKQSQAAVEKVDFERQRAIRDIIDAQVGIFAWESVVPLFASLLDGVVQIDFLERLQDATEGTGTDILELPEAAFLSENKIAELKKPARLAYRRKQIVIQVLEWITTGNDLERIHKSRMPITEFAKAIRGLATTWALKLPKDFEKQAAAGDEAVKLAIAEFDNGRKK